MEIMLQKSQITETWKFKHPTKGYIHPIHSFSKILFSDNHPCRHSVANGKIAVKSFIQVNTKIAGILASWLKRKGFLSFSPTSLRVKHSIAFCVSFNAENFLFMLAHIIMRQLCDTLKKNYDNTFTVSKCEEICSHFKWETCY